ncbi:Carboxylesterase A [Lasiodiplodia hormozganensis]|uniref:Carboxylesterase A n=1 Tax=Lasiodiplodia hormozganensis TaxID=869390 RepID=A0AA40D2W4_9PEZI|nr:Carboxylesterase A [Lasiodiplodia hormozganensis]
MKASAPAEPHHPRQPAPRRLAAAARSALLLVVLLYFAATVGRLVTFVGSELDGRARQHAEASKTPSFSWDAAPSAKHLAFQPCYRDFRCARVELPLDWWNGTFPDRHVSLAVTMLPAKVPVTDPRYGGPVLLNPGGPGGSGVDLVTAMGLAIQTIIDSPVDPASESPENSTSKYFDVVGFDPRGIGRTTPGAHCFRAASIRESWNLRLDSQGILGSSDAVLGRRWSMVNALGASCAGLDDDGDVKHYVTTASVARDMLELAELFGQYREAETWRILTEDAIEMCEKHGVCASLKLPEIYVPGTEKLQYWGFSYGTLLGSTFASMFPDRVGRLVLDGVVHGSNYMKTLWSDNLEDTEKTMQAFYDRCAEAGPTLCPLAGHNMSAVDIKAKATAVLDKMYHNPIQVKGEFPEIVTWSDVRLFMFMALYEPLHAFPLMAEMLAALARGDEDGEMERYLTSKHFFACAAKGNDTDIAQVDGEASMAIMCSDGDPQDYLDLDGMDEHWRKLDAISPTVGAMWAGHRMNCANWKFRPLFRFTDFKPEFGGDTSNPILWIGNTADPVTPLINAHKMKSLFPGSEVLTQNSPGHCSLAAFSPCTVGYIRNYFNNGTLPVPDTMCEPVEIPFIHPSPEVHLLSNDDIRAMDAHRSLGRSFAKNAWGLGKAMLPRGESGLTLKFQDDE